MFCKNLGFYQPRLWPMGVEHIWKMKMAENVFRQRGMVALDLRSTSGVLLPAAPTSRNDPRKVVHARVPLSSKQYNLASANGRWCSMRLGRSLGLASQWRCVTLNNSTSIDVLKASETSTFQRYTGVFCVWMAFGYFLRRERMNKVTVTVKRLAM